MTWAFIRKCLFMSLGLTRYYAHGRKIQRHEKAHGGMVVEPNASRADRRNILALASVLVVAGFAGADPRDLSVFGIRPDGDWGVIVIGTVAILTHVYWYILRYFHMMEEAIRELRIVDPASPTKGPTQIMLTENEPMIIGRKFSDLVSNWVCFLMTLISWYFVGRWIVAS